MDKKISKFAENLKDKLSGDKKLRIIVIIGLAGILLIFLSEMLSSDEKEVVKKDVISISETNYKEEIEKELTEIIGKISGVGDVRVMVTLAGTTEIVFAQEENISIQQSPEQYSEDYQNEYVIIEDGNSKEALVKKVLKPEIMGVLIVCKGGDSAVINEKVYKAVSTVLGIPSYKVCVVKG